MEGLPAPRSVVNRLLPPMPRSENGGLALTWRSKRREQWHRLALQWTPVRLLLWREVRSRLHTPQDKKEVISTAWELIKRKIWGKSLKDWPARGLARSGLGLLGAQTAQTEREMDCFGRCRPVAGREGPGAKGRGHLGKEPWAKG